MDTYDLAFIATAYGKTDTDPMGDKYLNADITGPSDVPDEIVDTHDLGLYGRNYCKTC